MCSLRAILFAIVALFLPFPVVAEAPELRDPLEPPGQLRSTTTTPSFNARAWRLASTLVADGRRVAIINDRTVRVGDRVGGARVLAIESGSVKLDYRGHRFTISRPGTGVSKR